MTDKPHPDDAEPHLHAGTKAFAPRQAHGLDDMAALTRPPVNQKTKELREKFRLAKNAVPVHSTWRHYKGGIYRIVGHVFDTDAQVVKARYERIGGTGYVPGAEHGIEFSRDVAEWSDTVPAPRHRLDSEPAEPERKRFVPVEKIERYESADEIKERG